MLVGFLWRKTTCLTLIQSIQLNLLASASSDIHVPSEEYHQVVLMLWSIARFLMCPHTIADWLKSNAVTLIEKITTMLTLALKNFVPTQINYKQNSVYVLDIIMYQLSFIIRF